MAESDSNRFTLFCCILEYGKGSELLKLSKKLGAPEGTVLLGKGTIKSGWLNALGLFESKKEIFITIIDHKLEDLFYQRVLEKFQLDKANHGIAFSTPLKYFLPVGSDQNRSTEREGDGRVRYESIFVIANKDSFDDIIEAAEAGGSTGGTVIHGRGAGSHEKAKLFNLEIEPEKVVVLILSQVEKTDAIVKSIEERLNIHQPNAGIIFVMDVTRTLGLWCG